VSGFFLVKRKRLKKRSAARAISECRHRAVFLLLLPFLLRAGEVWDASRVLPHRVGPR
jgi:hypothetical protein